MDSGYRLIFSGRTIYNEIDILNTSGIVGIGTIHGCRARFSREIFNQDFLITIAKTDSGWQVKCELGVYVEYEGKNYSTINIQQGDYLSVYSDSNKRKLFKLNCLITYDESAKTYDARLNMQGVHAIQVGNSNNCDVQLREFSRTSEHFMLENSGNGLKMSVFESVSGVYINGKQVIGVNQIKDNDFISCGPYSFYYCESYLYVTNSDNITSYSVPLEKVLESESALEYPKFNRNTRVKTVLSKEPITILDPPEIPQKPTDNIVMTLLPAIAMLVLVVVLRGVLNSNMGMYVVFSVCTMALGIATSIYQYAKTRKSYKKSIIERDETYKAYVFRKQEEIQNAREIEMNQLIMNYPNVDVTSGRVFSFSGDLFDRTLTDEDFLHIRLGLGSRKALKEIAYKPKDSLVIGDELQRMPENISEMYRYILNAPIVVDLKKAGIIGVIGDKEQSDMLLKVMIEDLCTRQFYDEVSMFLICSEEQAKEREWIRFLPHFQKDSGLARNIAYDEDSCDMQYEYLFRTLSIRESMTSSHGAFSAIVVLVLDPMGLYSHPVSKYLEIAKELGVYFIFLARNREELPLYCGNMINIVGPQTGVLINTEDDAEKTEFIFESILDSTMWNIALKLAPVYCEDVSVEGKLPKSFSLFALLGIQGADDLDLASRWNSSDITKSMAAPLGLKTGDEVISLDLHEKYHGPHGLVAGTTGSGKSEIIQSYVLSMATLYSPEDVGFVIIDFKGGGMANLFADLPHLMGAITDIDGKAINRSLMSIRAEIDKRKRWFAYAEVNNIGDYIKKYKANRNGGLAPLPHLILIIDEFAELKAEQPEFMKEVISAARVGRSLGIHLILATQKPAGVIDDQIWSNSRFKLCLKVQSKSDSNEVLKSPLAAEIREPGRAYLQVGNNEIFELFQSAYSGAQAKSEEMDHVKPFELFEVDGCGRRKLIYEKKNNKSSSQGEKSETQLEAIVKKIADFCAEQRIAKLPSICMPPLPEVIDFPDYYYNEPNDFSIVASIGYYDDPSTQAQYPVDIDISSNNLLIIGASQSGKTNLLMTIIRSLATKYTPQDVNMYILDFGPSMLSNFNTLPHVGGVVNDSDDEKIKNLFKLLNEEIAIRKQKMMSARVSSIVAYRGAGYTDMPLIVLFVDNFTALKELYFTNEDYLLPICRNGISVGISVIISNQNMQGIGFRYSASFAKRIAMHCNDLNDYTTLIDHCRTYPDDIPGRAVISIEKEIYEMQVYSCFAGEKDKDKADYQSRFIEYCRNKAGSMQAKVIPMIPTDLTMEYIEKCYPEKVIGENGEVAIVGLDYDSISPISIDLLTVGALGMIGKKCDESLTVIDNVLCQLGINSTISNADFYILDSVRHNLNRYSKCEATKVYSSDMEMFAEVIDRVYNEVEVRSRKWQESGSSSLSDNKLIVVVADGNDMVNSLTKNVAVVNKYKEILDKYLDMRVCFLFTHLDNLEVPYNGAEILKRLKDNKSILFFDSLHKLKFVQVSQSALRNAPKHQLWDGYDFTEGEPRRFKVAMKKREYD